MVFENNSTSSVLKFQNKFQNNRRSLQLLQLKWPSSKSACLWSGRHGFNSESGQTNDFKRVIHGFRAMSRRSALM